MFMNCVDWPPVQEQRAQLPDPRQRGERLTPSQFAAGKAWMFTELNGEYACYAPEISPVTTEAIENDFDEYDAAERHNVADIGLGRNCTGVS